MEPSSDTKVASRAAELFAAHYDAIAKRTDRLFAGLMAFQATRKLRPGKG